jgi:molybdopterin-guanine dinucleotide biosynthesis protein A
MDNVVTIVLGGGRGTRLFPLTHLRSKPAVPIGGKYRLIDIAISNCIHAGLKKIYVLTQFNSASLNRHVAQTYRMDMFSNGSVEVLAAEQTPEGEHWFQGTADAVRQAARHFGVVEAEYYLILAGDHVYRMDFGDCSRPISSRIRHYDRGAAVTPRRDGHGHFRFDVRADFGLRGETASDRWLKSDRACRRHPDDVDAGQTVCASMAQNASREVLPTLSAVWPWTSTRRSTPSMLRSHLSRLLGGRGHGGLVLRRQHDADQAQRRSSSIPAADLRIRACRRAIASPPVAHLRRRVPRYVRNHRQHDRRAHVDSTWREHLAINPARRRWL